MSFLTKLLFQVCFNGALWVDHSVAVMRLHLYVKLAWRLVRDVNSEMLDISISNDLASIRDIVNRGIDDSYPLDDLLQHSRNPHLSRFLCKVDIEAVIDVSKSLGRPYDLPIVNLPFPAGCFSPSCMGHRFRSVDVVPKEDQIKSHMADIVIFIVVDASVLVIRRLRPQENHYNGHKLQTHFIIYYKYFKQHFPSYHLPQKYTPEPSAYLICVDTLMRIEIINNQLILITMEHQQQLQQLKVIEEEEEEKGMKMEEGQKIGQQKSNSENVMLQEETIPHANPKTEQAYLKPKATEQFEQFDEQHEQLAAMFPSDQWQFDHPNINSQTIKTSQLHANLPIPQWMHSDDILKPHIPDLFHPKK